MAHAVTIATNVELSAQLDEQRSRAEHCENELVRVTNVDKSNGIPVRRIRYVFTVVMSPVLLPLDPLGQQHWLDEHVTKLREAVQPDRIGVTAVIEDAQ